MTKATATRVADSSSPSLDELAARRRELKRRRAELKRRIRDGRRELQHVGGELADVVAQIEQFGIEVVFVGPIDAEQGAEETHGRDTRNTD